MEAEERAERAASTRPQRLAVEICAWKPEFQRVFAASTRPQRLAVEIDIHRRMHGTDSALQRGHSD